MKLGRLPRALTHSPMAAPIVAVLLLGLALILLDIIFWEKLDLPSILVELHGLFLELVLLGCILLWFNLRVSHRETIKRIRVELEGLRIAEDEHSLSQKSAKIKRLNELGEPLGDLFAVRLQNQHLPDINFSRANMASAILKEAMLDNCKFEGADLRNANFSESWIRFTDFRNANLAFADFTGASLVGADLRGTDLQGAVLVGADLRNAKLDGAFTDRTNFTGADVTGAQGLGKEQA